MASKTESARDPESGAWWDESASPHSRPPPQQAQYNPPRHYVAPPMDTTRGHNAYDDSDSSGGFDWDRVAHIVLAVLLPPLGVFFQTGCNKDFAINVLLTLLGYV